MNYLEAKITITKASPRIPFKLFAIEAAALLGIAGLLVQFFA